MTDPTPDSTLDTGAGPRRGSPPGAPRWVKVSGIIAVVLALLVAAVLLFGGGGHGPARHGSAGATGGRPPALLSLALVTEPGGTGGHYAPSAGSPG